MHTHACIVTIRYCYDYCKQDMFPRSCWRGKTGIIMIIIIVFILLLLLIIIVIAINIYIYIYNCVLNKTCFLDPAGGKKTRRPPDEGPVRPAPRNY